MRSRSPAPLGSPPSCRRTLPQVHEALKAEMAHIHALSIKRAWTPQQQQAEQQKAAGAADGAAMACSVEAQ